MAIDIQSSRTGTAPARGSVASPPERGRDESSSARLVPEAHPEEQVTLCLVCKTFLASLVIFAPVIIFWVEKTIRATGYVP